MAKQIRLFTLSLFLVPSLAVQADDHDLVEEEESRWYISQMATYTDDDDERRLDDSIAGGEFRVGWKWTDTFALEGQLGYHRIDGWPEWPAVTQRQSQDFLDLGLNVVTSFNTDGNFSPYVLFGAGYLATETELGTSDNGPSGTAGVGLKYQFGNTPWSLRAEWRLRHAFGGDNSYSDNLSSLGVRYSFGGSSGGGAMAVVPETQSVTEADSDGDGILDSKDECPITPPGVVVDSTGCPADTDMDGVMDYQDECPGTSRGANVNSNGCAIIELDPVHFDTESAKLLDRTKRSLDASAAVLRRHPEIRLEIGGHADSRGPADYNMGLSERRAQSAHDYLVAQGVDPQRLTVRGYGETQPIASNETVEGLAKNRRVELKVLDR